MIREKLAWKLYPKYCTWEQALKDADQQITIFKEMLDKMKKPEIPDLVLSDGIRSQAMAKIYVNTGIELMLKAIELLLEVKE